MGTKEYWVVKATTVRLGFQNTYWIDKETFLLRRLEEVQRDTRLGKPATTGAVGLVESESYWITFTIFSVEEAKS